MRRFTVQLTRAAVKDLDAVPQADRRRLATELKALADLAASWPAGIKRLRGFGFPLYRLRSGDYRVVFRLDEPVVTIMRVINRKDLERTLRRLLGRPRRPSALRTLGEPLAPRARHWGGDRARELPATA